MRDWLLDAMPWISPLLVALISGIFTFKGVKSSAKASHDQTISEVKAQQEKQSAVIGEQISGIKDDIKRLEEKQDKHNAVIERTFKLEQWKDDIEQRINRIEVN